MSKKENNKQPAPVVPDEAMKLLEIARPYMNGPFGSVCGVWQERYARLLAAAPEQGQQVECEQLRKALAGMLFAFDDGVGREWNESLLNFARTLTPAEEYKA